MRFPLTTVLVFFIALAGAPVAPALWKVRREGHRKFSRKEPLAAVRGIDAFCAAGKCAAERDVTAADPPPPSTASFEGARRARR